MGLPEQLSSELQDVYEYPISRQPIPVIPPRQESKALCQPENCPVLRARFSEKSFTGPRLTRPRKSWEPLSHFLLVTTQLQRYLEVWNLSSSFPPLLPSAFLRL